MRKNPYYRLHFISGIPYLISFGQGTADFYHNMRVNDTGAFLWEHLDTVADTDELIRLCADHFACPPRDTTAMAQQVEQFIAALYAKGILLPELPPTRNVPYYKTLEIAGILLRLHGNHQLFAPELSDFAFHGEAPDNAPQMNIYVTQHSPLSEKPQAVAGSTLLLSNEALCVLEGTDGYTLIFPSFHSLSEAVLSKDGQEAVLRCRPLLTAHAVREISYAIRVLFLYRAQLQEKLVIHSSSILYRDKIWLFSAPSGTGKSTHAALWQAAWNTPIINGDLNLVSLIQGETIVQGTPWCGTSGIYSRDAHPLGGILFLQQGGCNQISTPPADLSRLYVLHRCLSPNWTADMLNRNLNAVQQLFDKIMICQLTCTRDGAAVECAKSAIDAYLDKK